MFVLVFEVTKSYFNSVETLVVDQLGTVGKVSTKKGS